MTVTVFLRYILLCLLITSVVRAETRVPTTRLWQPPTSVLPPKELEPLLQEWDAAMAGDKFYDKGSVCSAVGGFIPKGQRFADAYFLRYSNPEIIDRVINHYLEAAANEAAGQWVASDASSEGSAEYMMFLAEAAESTFDPRIHEAVLRSKSGFAGSFQHLYLATVNTKRTLHILSDAKPGPHGRIQWGPNAGQRGHPEYFYHPEIGGLSIVSVYDILSLMITQSPEVLRAERTQVLSFVAKHVKHFETLQNSSYKPKSVDFQWYDYRVRSAGLDVVGFLGTALEVKLVEEIIDDAHEVNFEKFVGMGQRNKQYEQIREKGQRIIKQIRGRSPSER